MFHFCAQELQAIVSIIPFVNHAFHYACMLTNKAYCKALCKEEPCCEEPTTSKGAWDLSEEERDSASKGEICPSCKKSNIKYMGCNPDGINVNNCFDCLDCDTQWEGY